MHEEPWLPSDKPQGQIRIEDQVKPWVAGMKTLVISNRADPELEKRLSDKLGLDITWAVCDVRRAQAQAAAIRRNKYDLVIAQTGFMGHKVEETIAPACRDVQIPYIRADKARPASTALALIRDLGIDLKKEPPRDIVRVTAPPQESNNGRIRRRKVVTVPQTPGDYKDLDIDLLKFLEKQGDYFRMEDILRELKGIPVVSKSDGSVDWHRMRAWVKAVSELLRGLNYVNAQLPTSVHPDRPRVWLRRDRQYKIGLESVRNGEKGNTRKYNQELSPLRAKARTKKPGRKPQSKTKRWLVKYERDIRAFAKDRLYVHPEDVMHLIGVELPPPEEIVWQNFMFWTKNIGNVLRKMGFNPRSRQLSDGRKARVWIHKSAPRYFDIVDPGEEYVHPRSTARTTKEPALRAQSPKSEPEPSPSPAPVRTPVAKAPAVGPKSVRISFSSIEGGDANELLLVLTQAGWAVSFGP